MPELLANRAALEMFLHSRPICLLYFSTPDCGVCAVLKPKLGALLEQEFPKIAFAEVNCARSPALAGTARGHPLWPLNTAYFRFPA
jgi:thioredoxin-like negative regulator of GroEL